jgi:hypothetical protein
MCRGAGNAETPAGHPVAGNRAVACDHGGMDDAGPVGRWGVEARYGATSMEDEELVARARENVRP